MVRIGALLHAVNPLSCGVWRRFSIGASRGVTVVPPPPEGTGYVIHGAPGDWGYVLTQDGARVLYQRSEG